MRPLLAVLVVWIIVSVPARSQTPADSTVTSLIGAKGMNILKSAQQMEYLRVGPSLPDSRQTEVMEGVRALAPARTASRAVTLRVSRLLLDERTYTGYVGGCGFKPVVAFRFRRGPEKVELLLGYECQQILVAHTDAKGQRLHSGFGWFQARVPLVRLARELFPGDPVIQSLSETRSLTASQP